MELHIQLRRAARRPDLFCHLRLPHHLAASRRAQAERPHLGRRLLRPPPVSHLPRLLLLPGRDAGVQRRGAHRAPARRRRVRPDLHHELSRGALVVGRPPVVALGRGAVLSAVAGGAGAAGHAPGRLVRVRGRARRSAPARRHLGPGSGLARLRRRGVPDRVRRHRHRLRARGSARSAVREPRVPPAAGVADLLPGAAGRPRRRAGAPPLLRSRARADHHQHRHRADHRSVRAPPARRGRACTRGGAAGLGRHPELLDLPVAAGLPQSPLGFVGERIPAEPGPGPGRGRALVLLDREAVPAPARAPVRPPAQADRRGLGGRAGRCARLRAGGRARAAAVSQPHRARSISGE